MAWVTYIFLSYKTNIELFKVTLWIPHNANLFKARIESTCLLVGWANVTNKQDFNHTIEVIEGSLNDLKGCYICLCQV